MLFRSANINDVCEIFSCWKEVEAALVGRSKFFTLIDIYGHYANRGDVVDIEVIIKNHSNEKLIQLIEFFSQTSNCGDFITESTLLDKFKLAQRELESIIDSMRALRYDIRTSVSHPIIGRGRVICTYPFPLLSPKAMVESKVKFAAEEIAYVGV